MACLKISDGIFIITLFLCLCPAVAADLNSDNPISTSPSSSMQSPAYSINLFVPDTNSIHSIQIMDLITMRNGDVLIATSAGLSQYNGSWETRSINHDNFSAGLMDNFVTAIEYDHDGNLWIGYPGGIQIYNGNYYRVLRDQQLFKDLRIRNLQRWNDEMWVASGNAGLHQYRDTAWTWYQPFSDNGPGFYEADSMALDSANNCLLVATEKEGLWQITEPNGTPVFEKIRDNEGPDGLLQHVRQNPLGGVFFFSGSDVALYRPGLGFMRILSSGDLDVSRPMINDITGGSDGKLFVGTDKGIYIWENGQVYRHLGRQEGIGTSPSISSIDADAHNRIWFSTRDDVGYYVGDFRTNAQIPIEMVTPTIEQTTVPVATPVVNVSPAMTPAGSQPPVPSLLDQIIVALSSFFSSINPVH